MKSYAAKFGVMASVLVLAACGGNSNPVQNAVEATEDPALQAKTFTSKCSVTPVGAVLTGLFTGGAAAVKSSATSYRFTGANVTRKTEVFQSADCTGEAALEFSEIGAFDILDDNKTADGGRLIDMDFKKLEVTVKNDAGLKVANAVSLCGTNNWSDNQKADVTTKSEDVNCYNAKVPRMQANIYKLEGSVLYLGTMSKDPVAKSARPASLDRSQGYTAK